MSQSIFKNPYVLNAPALQLGSIGNGTLTIDRLTHFTINQSYTVICSAIAPFTVFNVIGNLDGAVGVAVVGTQFTDEDNKIFFTIQQGPTLFQIGDTFTLEVAQGTDLNQQNIDAFDELPQKNFGLGITGLLRGDHNLRFSSTPAYAFKNVGDLKFTSKVIGPPGNSISIEYLAGSLLTAASLTMQALTFTAFTEGEEGNDISIEYGEIDLAEQAVATVGDVEFLADLPGEAGNNISIQYIGGGVKGSEIVTVFGTVITIQIQDGVTTADDIEVACALSEDASALIGTTGLGETGAEPQYIQGPIFLSGGTDQDGDAIIVTGNHILVKFETGVSTAEEVYNLITDSAEALSLISVDITGVAESVMTNPEGPSFLTGGLDEVGSPGNEIVEVVGNEIKVTFINGQSTAAQIKTAIEANVDAAALVDITFLGTGSEFQSSPYERRSLSGGRSGGTFAFNTSELSDPDTFYEGNAPVLLTDLTNQGDELTLGETVKKGRVELDDDILSNVSGPKVENTQKTINNIIQNQKLFLKTEDNSKVDWQIPEVSFLSDILIVLPESGYLNRILTSESPITINDGEHAYVELNRLANATVTVQIDTSIPTGENILRLFTRMGDDLIWYDNTLQRDKKKIRIGEGGGGGTAFQEKIGTGNGSEKKFPLTYIPSNEYSILLICSYAREYGTEYTYNPIGNQIEFVTGQQPQFGQDVYVFYLTDGETLEVPTPAGVLQSYVHLVTALEEAAKEITLIAPPALPSKILVDVIGGGAQEFNEDFTISTDKFQWASFALDGQLAEGDKVRFYFYS